MRSSALNSGGHTLYPGSADEDFANGDLDYSGPGRGRLS